MVVAYHACLVRCCGRGFAAVEVFETWWRSTGFLNNRSSTVSFQQHYANKECMSGIERGGYKNVFENSPVYLS